MMAQMNNKAHVITTAGLLAGLAMAGIPPGRIRTRPRRPIGVAT
jgi:hypothetical protein